MLCEETIYKSTDPLTMIHVISLIWLLRKPLKKPPDCDEKWFIEISKSPPKTQTKRIKTNLWRWHIQTINIYVAIARIAGKFIFIYIWSSNTLIKHFIQFSIQWWYQKNEQKTFIRQWKNNYMHELSVV